MQRVKVETINPHGFCWGVKNAVEKALGALAGNPPPVYCLHALVHNSLVVENLKARGMRFVDSLDDVPNGATVLFSAHGISPAVRESAEERNLRVIDATCPFVARAHGRLAGFARRGIPVVIIGHAAHVEVQGLAGEMRGGVFRVISTVADVATLPFEGSDAVGVVCQTTLSDEEVSDTLAALRARYPLLETSSASDVCTATRDRQAAVRSFVRGGGDGVLVLGSPSSSNTLRLVEIAGAEGAKTFRAGTSEEIAACGFSGIKRLGVTSGASTPESFFNDALKVLSSL